MNGSDTSRLSLFHAYNRAFTDSLIPLKDIAKHLLPATVKCLEDLCDENNIYVNSGRDIALDKTAYGATLLKARNTARQLLDLYNTPTSKESEDVDTEFVRCIFKAYRERYSVEVAGEERVRLLKINSLPDNASDDQLAKKIALMLLN